MITIIVLLILSAVTVAILTGDNGILNQAQSSKDSTRGGEVQDIINVAVAENKIAEYTGETVKTRAGIISDLYNNGKLTDDEVEELNETDVIEIGNVKVDFSGLSTKNYISKDEETVKSEISEKGYVGYYADIDDNGKIDGIIYADLAVTVKDEQWGDSWGDYSYEKKDDLKDYTVSTWTYEGQTTAGVYKANDIWGEKKVIVPAKKFKWNY